MSTSQKRQNGNMVAIITMCFIFAMISFVTNMGAPFGNIWGFTYPWANDGKPDELRSLSVHGYSCG